jgi:hypothetical protein
MATKTIYSKDERCQVPSFGGHDHSLQQRLVKTGGRLVKHARYYWLLLAESHRTRRLLAPMVRRLEWLPLPGG